MDALSTAELGLIAGCYYNRYGFDFKEFHFEKCNLSKNEPFLIDMINHSKRTLFSDDKGSDFKLIIHDGLVYLLSETSCYPCSNVVESAHGDNFNWVQCFVLPKGEQVLGETDIRKSAVIISFFNEIVAAIEDEKFFFAFIEDLKHTFAQCAWFKQINSVSSYFKIAKFWNYREKIKKLFDYGLLYPLELVIYAIYKDLAVTTDLFIKYFFRSLAESTNRIFNEDEIYRLVNSLGTKDVDLLLGVDTVRKNIRLDLIDDDYMADLLDIDSYKRYPTFVCDNYYVYHVQERANELFYDPAFRRDYLSLLKRSFRGLENKIRKGKGFEQVGSFFMERLLFNKLTDLFPNLTILSQHSPKWLSPQRFDIFVKECNYAIEYNGIQHFQPISFFGGEEGFELIKILDERKRGKSKRNGIRLFEIRFDDDFEQIFEILTSEIEKRFQFRDQDIV